MRWRTGDRLGHCRLGRALARPNIPRRGPRVGDVGSRKGSTQPTATGCSGGSNVAPARGGSRTWWRRTQPTRRSGIGRILQLSIRVGRSALRHLNLPPAGGGAFAHALLTSFGPTRRPDFHALRCCPAQGSRRRRQGDQGPHPRKFARQVAGKIVPPRAPPQLRTGKRGGDMGWSRASRPSHAGVGARWLVARCDPAPSKTRKNPKRPTMSQKLTGPQTITGPQKMTGAEMVIQALADQGVEARVRLSRRRRAADLRRISSSRRRSSTSWCARRAARCMRPRAMRARPARSAWCW